MLAAVLMAAFLVVETRVASAPLVPLGLLRRPALAGANLAMLCVGGSMFAMWYFASLYLQGVLGESPLRAGLAFLPASLAVIAGPGGRPPGAALRRPAGPGGRAARHRRGLAVDVAGVGGRRYATDILGPIVVAALGLGLSFPPGTYAATAGVAPRDAGLASGLVNSMRQIGGAVGLATLATIAVHQTASALAGGEGANAALVSGYGQAFLVGAGIAVAASLSALIIPGGRASAPGRPLIRVTRGLTCPCG